MSDDSRICADCKHYKGPGSPPVRGVPLNFICLRIASPPDIITGAPSIKMANTCEFQRGTSGECGPHGHKFESNKPPVGLDRGRFRLIPWKAFR